MIRVIDLKHPSYVADSIDWLKWRLSYKAGSEFIDRYLRKLSKRESEEDFEDRKAVTYCPAFAKSAVLEIRDSIYQRMAEIARVGGSREYQKAITGLDGGVDRKGSSMNYFMGCKILPELLVMRRVGVYVDMPRLQGKSIIENRNIRPYVYAYPTENILCWTGDDNNHELDSVLLMENVYSYDDKTGFPNGYKTRYRHLWKNEFGTVSACFYNDKCESLDPDDNKIDEPITLNIRKIPFVMLEIEHSLMSEISDYQIALMNLASTDMGYALKSNYPFYTEQRDLRPGGEHVMPGNQTNGGEAASRVANAKELSIGVSRGRIYGKGLDRPEFIHPSPEPLRISMEKQEQMKREIKTLVRLTVSDLQGPKMASAESKKQDMSSLEAGLSYIGMELERAERSICEIWSAYEGDNAATVSYPTNYDLKTESERNAEANNLEESLVIIPSSSYQKEIAKQIVKIRLERKVSPETLERISDEIENSATMTSDPEVLAKDLENGLVGTELASKIRGYPEGEVEKAKQDHADRLARIAIAQTEGAAAARGIPDASGDPVRDARQEKKTSRDTTQQGDTRRRYRGKGKG